jgi:DNA-binding PucR family transcriptional regulator
VDLADHEVAPGDIRAEGLPGDLRAGAASTWGHLDVPAGWEPVAQIAHEVHDNLSPLVERITDAIEQEVDAYRYELVPRADLRGSVRRNIEALLVGLAERRPPTAEQVAVRRELGTRRAIQGLPIDALIKAYHVGYREVWASLVEALPPNDDEATTKLLTGATTVWQWVHEVTDALAAAHAATTRSLEAREVGARQRFAELLVAGDLGGKEARRLATSLGLIPTGTFTVLVVQGATDELDAVEVQHRLDEVGGQHAVAVRANLVIVVSQDGDVEVVAETCREVFRTGAIAVGATREGLDGARASLEDAEQALVVTDEGQVVAFEDVWLWATLLSSADRLEPLLAGGHEVAHDHPHLAEAVRAFAEGGFSVSEAARRLGLHANTVSYRLDRWQELTGWNPRTFAGLSRSVAALGPHH